MIFNNPKVDTFSHVYQFLYNDFGWINRSKNDFYTVQSLLASASLYCLKDDLKILKDIDTYKDLGFDLLVQRQIDENRVDIDIVENYLRKEDKTHFFPPLVVALIPTYTQQIKNGYKTVVNLKESAIKLEIGDSANGNSIIVDFQHNSAEGDTFEQFIQSEYLKYGEFKWNKTKFNAIVIDGQHRFRAIQKFLRTNSIESLQNKFFIAVNFVVIQPNPDKIEAMSGREYIRVARELFIDINKNAKSVSETRLILLDDRDLRRYISRMSIRQYNSLEVPNYNYYDWKNDDGNTFLKKIPQEIVSWNTDLNSKDEQNINLFSLAQITSTTLIYKIVKDFIFYKKNETMYDTFKRVFEFENWLPNPANDLEKEVDHEVRRKKKKFDEALEEINAEEVEQKNNNSEFDSSYFEHKRFSLSESSLEFEVKFNDWLSNWFFEKSKYGIAISVFYTSFKPYAEFIKCVENVFSNFEANKPIIDIIVDPENNKPKSFFESKLPNEDLKSVFSDFYNTVGELRKKYDDVRLTVFQRAFFANLEKTYSILEQVFPNQTDEYRIVKYVEGLSILSEKGILKRGYELNYPERSKFLDSTKNSYQLKSIKIWNGLWISDNNEGTIKYRDNDAYKICDLLRILSIAALTKKDFSRLQEDYNKLESSIKSVQSSYNSQYVKMMQNHFDLNTQQEVRNNKIVNTEVYEQEITNIIEDAIKIVIT